MYLVNIKIKKYRFVLTKFRLSSHQLEIETGRGKQPVNWPNINKFQMLMKSEQRSMLCKLSKYIYLANIKRDGET